MRPYEDFVFKDNAKFEEDKISYQVDYDLVVRKLNELKGKLSENEKLALLSFIMPLESNWNDKINLAKKILGYSETMKFFGSIARRRIGKIL